jgi:dipeptide/tripeptide permease
MKKTPFSGVFWIANLIEVLERFAYYGIYFSFGIYMASLGYSKGDLGIIQFVLLLFSYVIPVITGSMADRWGFKKVMIASYLIYIPAILLLIITKTFSGIALTMLGMGLAAGVFKPLVAGTVRAVTDKSNTTLGFGIFYAMVNIGGSFGPIVLGKLRAVSWNTAFTVAAATIGLALLITIFLYKEPERQIEGTTLSQKMRDIWIALSDLKFLLFLIILGLFFWIPFWGFFNLAALYVDESLDTIKLYLAIKSVLGTAVADFLSRVDENGDRRILGETIAHTGYIIMILQIFISKIFEKFKAMPSFLFGLFVASIGFIVIGISSIFSPSFVFLGILLFAVGEMISSPRIQEYITWIAPKEKAGLYMGANFLAVGFGAFSGLIYTPLYGYFTEYNQPGNVWFVMAGHLLVGMIVIFIFTKISGGFESQEH